MTSSSAISTAVKALKVSEDFYVSNNYDSSQGGLELQYIRLAPAAAAAELKKRDAKEIEQSRPVSGSTYGTTCPSCGKEMIETMRYTTSDGFFGLERDTWVCRDTEHCGIVRNCRFAGYGSV